MFGRGDGSGTSGSNEHRFVKHPRPLFPMYSRNALFMRLRIVL
jgi:hypothetical protein